MAASDLLLQLDVSSYQMDTEANMHKEFIINYLAIKTSQSLLLQSA